jgi:chromosome partitioning protein
MEIISIINNKGGVGKTTSVQNIAVSLSLKGYSVGVVDFDPQANLSRSFKFELKSGLRDVLENRTPITRDLFSETTVKNVFILPNQKDITSKVFSNVDETEKIYLFKDLLTDNIFDYLIIDTQPNLDIQTINAMVASTQIIIPVEYDVYSIDGLKTLCDYITKIQARPNPKLNLLGIYITQIDERQGINKVIETILQRDYKDLLFDSKIRVNSKYRQAQLYKMSIFEFDDEKGIQDYNNIAQEILDRINKK